jgi:hypothetical protein
MADEADTRFVRHLQRTTSGRGGHLSASRPAALDAPRITQVAGGALRTRGRDTSRAIEVRAITDADAPRLGEFLAAQFAGRPPPSVWARAVLFQWQVDRPNAGYMLVDDGVIVGAHLAHYAERTIDGKRERFCNLGAWAVLPAYRVHALRLLMALIRQDGYHFTDLTPRPHVVAINRRLGFAFLDTSTILVPNIPIIPWIHHVAVTSDPAVLARTLTGDELQIYKDHAMAPAARHVMLIRGDESCYVMFRTRLWHRARIACVLHVSDPDAFVKLVRPLRHHLLLHHGAVATQVETRLVERLPRPRRACRRPPKMFLSSRLAPDQIDDLYSELVCLPQ